MKQYFSGAGNVSGLILAEVPWETKNASFSSSLSCSNFCLEQLKLQTKPTSSRTQTVLINAALLITVKPEPHLAEQSGEQGELLKGTCRYSAAGVEPSSAAGEAGDREHATPLDESLVKTRLCQPKA